MHKKLGLVLVVVFLSVQMLSLLHMAEHNFEKHEHNGKICSIFLYGEQTKSADTATPLVLSEQIFTEAKIQSFVSIFLSKALYKGATPRAPPILLS